MSVVRHYEIHGEVIEVESASVAWADAVNEILGAYRGQPIANPTMRVTLRERGNDLHVPRQLEERGRFGGLVFYLHPPTQCMWMDVHGKGWVEVDVAAGRLDAALSYDPREDEWFVAHHAFYPGLLELLKARGFFPTHAGLVAKDQDGVLICGASGSGKTTLCLNLATHGWDFLADDTCFLREHAEAVEGLAFWEDLHVTEETLRRFEELAFLRAQTPRRENWKRHFAVEQLAQLKPSERCVPRAVVFPRVRAGRDSELVPISAHEALLRLMPQSMIPVLPGHTEAQLRVLGKLVRQGEAFEFHMGEELDEVRACLEAHLLGSST